MPDARPHCSVYIATSLDGYIAREDGGIDWLGRVEAEGEDYGFSRFYDSVDVVVLGRRTYETALGFGGWPYGSKRCIVLTHRPMPSLHGESSFAGTAAALLDRLAAEGARRVYVDGGQVIGQFLAAGLIDDMTISVIPVLLGAGRRLFGGGEREGGWALEDCRSYPTGLVQLRYRVVGPAPSSKP